jgi:hypothetical protein
VIFENMVFRRIFGPHSEEVAGDWRKLHSEELRNLLPTSNVIKKIMSRAIRWAGHRGMCGESER